MLSGGVHIIVLFVRCFFYYYFLIAFWCCGDCSSGLIGNQINQEIPCGHRSFWGIIWISWNCDWPQKWAALSVYCRHPTGICFRTSEVFLRSEENSPWIPFFPQLIFWLELFWFQGYHFFNFAHCIIWWCLWSG